MKKSRLELRLPDDMKDDLKRLAAKRGVTMTLLVESALMELITADKLETVEPYDPTKIELQ